MRSLGNALFVVMGSTGSGKSSLAVDLAVRLKCDFNFEAVGIINCDAQQFYEDLPVATNKVTSSEMKGIPHFFIGFLDRDDRTVRPPEEPYCGADVHVDHPDIKDDAEEFNVDQYSKRVCSFIGGYFNTNRNSCLLLCGGTCYYLQSVIFSNMLTPLSEEMHDERSPIEDVPDEELWERINEVDPVIADRYHPNDTRRLRRLLQIHHIAGEKPSDVYRMKPPSLRYAAASCFFIWCYIEPSHLGTCLDQRVDAMVDNGLVTEVEDFWSECEQNSHHSISDAIGYKEFHEYLMDSGGPHRDASLRTAVAKVKSNTRRYARQQVRWIRNRFVRQFASIADFPPEHFVQISPSPTTGLYDGAAVLGYCLAGQGPPEYSSHPLKASGDDVKAVHQEFCEVCNTRICGRDQFELHLKSKRHRGSLRRKELERRQLLDFGRVLPPVKRVKRD